MRGWVGWQVEVESSSLGLGKESSYEDIDDEPIKVLKMKYAKGEITTEDYKERIKELKKN